MKFKSLILAAFIIGTFEIISCSKDDSKVNDTDYSFMFNANLSNNAEISAATVASTKASNAAVKAFAKQMLSEHATAQTDLKKLATSVSYVMKDSIDSVHIVLVNKLKTLSGRAFDSTYIYSQVSDHQTALTNYKNEQEYGQHKDVLNYANSYRPHIEMHLSASDSIARAYFRR